MTNEEHTEVGGELGLAELFHEVTGFGEARTRAMAKAVMDLAEEYMEYDQ